MHHRLLFSSLFALLAICEPAFGKGHHIVCDMTISVSQGTETPRDFERSFGFYLDDSGEHLVGESGAIDVQTTLYSDTRINADISDHAFGSHGEFLFGSVKDGAATLIIDRTSGWAVIAAKLIPHGGLAGMGNCRTIRPSPAKF